MPSDLDDDDLPKNVQNNNSCDKFRLCHILYLSAVVFFSLVCIPFLPRLHNLNTVLLQRRGELRTMDELIQDLRAPIEALGHPFLSLLHRTSETPEPIAAYILDAYPPGGL